MKPCPWLGLFDTVVTHNKIAVPRISTAMNQTVIKTPAGDHVTHSQWSKPRLFCTVHI